MNKFLLIGILTGLSGAVQATTINAPSSLVGNETLWGNDAYSWGISVAVPTGQQIVSAEVDFTSINLNLANSSGIGYLYTDLLNAKTSGVGIAVDNDAPGDYWATKFSGANITALGKQTFSLGQTETWSYVLSTSQLAALNSYLTANGAFTIGIDPDCHFTVGGISFTYNFGPTPHNSPDIGATAFLLVMGLAGLEVFRRQFVGAKAKA